MHAFRVMKAVAAAKLSIWLVSAGSASFVSDPPPLLKFIIKSFGHIHLVPLIFVSLSDIVFGLFSVESLSQVSHSWVRVFGINHIVAADYSGASHSTVWNMLLCVDLAEHRMYRDNVS
jgi:hypothetical protein